MGLVVSFSGQIGSGKSFISSAVGKNTWLAAGFMR